MKINKKVSSKKSHPIVFAVLAALLILGIYTASAYAFTLWPFNTNDTTNTGADNETDGTKPDTEGVTNDGDTNPEDDDSSDFIDPPLQNPPTSADPYPIENEKYKIAQTNEKSFMVTLYPIANNPEYSDYNAQLKAYKADVLAYLKNRYGSTTELSITWSPSDAQNL